MGCVGVVEVDIEVCVVVCVGGEMGGNGVRVETRAKAVEDAIMTLNSGDSISEGLGAILDISMLKFEQRDLVADALRRTNRKARISLPSPLHSPPSHRVLITPPTETLSLQPSSI
jgi:hypothetical protein